MDARIFRVEPMQLRPEMLRLPMEARFAFDTAKGVFFANFEGCTVRNAADVAQIRSLVLAQLQPLNRKVPAIVGYDNFTVLPDALEAYVDMAREVATAHYSRVSRYTTSAFMRAKLGDALRQRGVAPHIFESALEARQHLDGLTARDADDKRQDSGRSLR
jgi:propionate CoA-transferase